MKSVFGSVIYPQAAIFFKDFMQSLKRQTVQDFDIILINDHMSKQSLLSELKEFITFFGKRLMIISPDTDDMAPYQLRIELLRNVKIKNYDLLILGDCDDTFATNRIECIQNQYDKKYAFFYNKLLNFENHEIMPELPPNTCKIDMILEQNYLGLSNTALAMDKLSMEYINSLKEGNLMVFDWYMFSRLVLGEKYGKRIDNTYTSYRLHADNIAGLAEDSIEYLEKERKIKLQHYNVMKKYDPRYKMLLDKYNTMEISEYRPAAFEKVFWWGKLVEK